MSSFPLIFVIVLAAIYEAHGGFITFNYGGRANKLYVPNNYNPNQPNGYAMFVMLHGCTQDPNSFATGTMMNDYAEQYGFFVLYPIQPSTANMNKCWNWFETAHQARGYGEPAFIAGATDAVSEQYNIDQTAIFCAGISAGGAMTAIMGATYPDKFTSLGIAAGLEYKAATSVLSAYTAMSNGGPDPKTQGVVAWNSMKDNYKWPLEVLVIHGTADYTVNIKNGHQATDQWIQSDNYGLGGGSNSQRIPFEPTVTVNGQVPGGYAYTDYEYSDPETGVVLVHKIIVTGMGHAWSGGDSAGGYADPKGPDASLFMVKWFLNYDKGLAYGRGRNSTRIH